MRSELASLRQSCVALRYTNDTIMLQGQPNNKSRMWHDPTMEPNERLVKARLAKGIRFVARAARELGMARSTYAAHEDGTRNFDEHAEKYAEFYGVDADWLLTGRGAGPDMRSITDAPAQPADSPDLDLWRQAWALAKQTEEKSLKTKLGMHDLMSLAELYFEDLKRKVD